MRVSNEYAKPNRMTNQAPRSNIAAFLATFWGRVLAILAAVSLIVGIYIEIVQAVRATVDFQILTKKDTTPKASQGCFDVKAKIELAARDFYSTTHGVAETKEFEQKFSKVSKDLKDKCGLEAELKLPASGR